MGRSRTRRERKSEAPEFDPLREYEKGTAEYYVASLFFAIRANHRLVLGSLLAIVLVGLSLAIFVTLRENQARAGQVAFEKLLKEPVMQSEGAEKAALTRLDEYLAQNTDIASRERTRVYRITYLRKSGELYRAAEEAMQLAREFQGEPTGIYFAALAGYLYEQDGKWPESQEAFNLALGAMAEDTEVKGQILLGLGRGLLHMGRKNDAASAFEKVLALPETMASDDVRLMAVAYLLKTSP